MSTPKEQWLVTEALVYSVDWIDPSRYDEGHYTWCTPTKLEKSGITGEFKDFYSGDSPLHENDTISIRYCPERPGKSYYPDAVQLAIDRNLMFAIGGTLGVLALILSYLINRHH